MFDPSSFANPTPLAHADTSRDALPKGGTSHGGTDIEPRPSVLESDTLTNSLFFLGHILRSSALVNVEAEFSARAHELKLLEAVQLCSEENMKAASKEVQNLKESTTCGVSVDGSWQRRGHMSLNGCVSVISNDTGKILDLEVMTQYCKMCELNVKREHVCSNYKGSSGNMEAVGAFRIFERSLIKRDLQYTEYYGDGDSKGFLQVKDIYGENSVTKLECIGHIQKRVGSRLRKLKNTKGLGGKGKLTDKFIDKLQNYYGIPIRSNVGYLEKMQSAVIAAFFHCCSSNQNPMHGQCPTGKDS
ncbi:uncharacterized protein TNCV_2801631 [Trichonephila clavipes]|nr:uncharacterized protein TNCV_2801631 [Trichonephila clavipes]